MKRSAPDSDPPEYLALYPPRVETTHRIDDVHREWQARRSVESPSRDVRIAGRIVDICVCDEYQKIVVADGSGADFTARLTAILPTPEPFSDDGPENDLKTGDHVALTGNAVVRIGGILALVAHDVTVIAVARRELPDGTDLGDEESRMRHRHVDLLINLESRRHLINRAKIVQELRSALWDAGFLEIDTPILQAGSDGPKRSFRVSRTGMQTPLYLRTSPLYMKRLVTAGFDRVFEISRSFRQEELDATHLTEYSLVEICWTYRDYIEMRRLAQELIRAAAAVVTGGEPALTWAGINFDLDEPWPVVSIYDAVGKALNCTIGPNVDRQSLVELARVNNVVVDDDSTADQIVLKLYDKRVEPFTLEPTFYTDFPRSQAPFARAHRHDPRLAEKWDLVILGREIATSYTELVDPLELRRNITAPVGLDSVAETSAVDAEFLAVVDSGIPPYAGLAIGLERLVMILSGANSIRDVIPFPLVVGGRSDDNTSLP